MGKRVFYYQRITYKELSGVRVLRCYGENSCVEVPDSIASLPVLEIGPYCFAENGHLDRVKYEIWECLEAPGNEGLDTNASFDGAEIELQKLNAGLDRADIYGFDAFDEMSDWNAAGTMLSGIAGKAASAGNAARPGTAESTFAYEITEQAGRYITEAILPSSLRKLYAYAFYNCRKLESLTFAGSLEEIENDAFMNCTSLRYLNVLADIHDTTPLKQVLAQISWNVEVAFYTESPKSARSRLDSSEERNAKTATGRFGSSRPQALLLFPEYQEYYEELGPTHFFSLILEGEGFRTRQCFVERTFKLEEYDKSFAKLSVEEAPRLGAIFALDRLMYPLELGKEIKDLMTAFIGKHELDVAKVVLEREEDAIDQFRFLFENHYFSQDILQQLLAIAAQEENAELSASLIKWKRDYFSVSKASRYEFDDF